MFLHCPINIIGGQRFTLGVVDWSAVTYRLDSCFDNGDLFSVYDAANDTPLIDVNWLDAYPQCQRDVATLSMLEFYMSVCDVKYLPSCLFSGDIQDRSCKIVAFGCRNVVERCSPYDNDDDDENKSVTADIEYSLGIDMTDEILKVCMSLCDESYNALKSSPAFVCSEREITSTNLSESRLLDYVHTCAAIVDTLSSHVEMSYAEQDLFIPDHFKTKQPQPQMMTTNDEHLPSIQMWFRSLDRCIYRLKLLRDDSENTQIAFLSGMAVLF